MTKNPPSMNALAKRIIHPKWTSVEPVVDILEKAVGHPLWYRTKIQDEAGEIILRRLVDLPATNDAQTLSRVNEALGRMFQKRSLAALGFPAIGAISALVEKEYELKKEGLPWMTAAVENTSNGALVMSVMAPAAFEGWLAEGKMSDKTALDLAVRYVRYLKKCINASSLDDDKTIRRRNAYLFLLERMAGRGEDQPHVWLRLSNKLGIDSLDKFSELEHFCQKQFPKLRSGLKRALLSKSHAPITQTSAQSIPKM